MYKQENVEIKCDWEDGTAGDCGADHVDYGVGIDLDDNTAPYETEVDESVWEEYEDDEPEEDND